MRLITHTPSKGSCYWAIGARMAPVCYRSYGRIPIINNTTALWHSLFRSSVEQPPPSECRVANTEPESKTDMSFAHSWDHLEGAESNAFTRLD
jgi:hypothetical protein